jgi:hypothetical protein
MRLSVDMPHAACPGTRMRVPARRRMRRLEQRRTHGLCLYPLARSSARLTLPEAVLGSSETNSTMRGYL